MRSVHGLEGTTDLKTRHQKYTWTWAEANINELNSLFQLLRLGHEKKWTRSSYLLMFYTAIPFYFFHRNVHKNDPRHQSYNQVKRKEFLSFDGKE
jgi:hypothetical protein